MTIEAHEPHNVECTLSTDCLCREVHGRSNPICIHYRRLAHVETPIQVTRSDFNVKAVRC